LALLLSAIRCGVKAPYYQIQRKMAHRPVDYCFRRRNETKTTTLALVFSLGILAGTIAVEAFTPAPLPHSSLLSPFYKKYQQLTLPQSDRTNLAMGKDDGYDGLGEYDPSENIRPEREVVVGDPQIKLKEKERSVTSILKELAAIQQQGPQKYCILGTRHCSYLHQQIIELL
jgi:hypothetical protein